MAEVEVVACMAGERSTRSAVGAISELRACAFLMNAGYYVYRCESPHAPFDLVAYKDGACQRVEVKTLSRQVVTHAPGFSWPGNSEWDLLLVVDTDRVLCFDSATTADEARAAVRAAYGFGPYVPWNKGQRERSRLALLEYPQLSHNAIAKRLGVSGATVSAACQTLMDDSSIAECSHRFTENGKPAPGPKPKAALSA